MDIRHLTVVGTATAPAPRAATRVRVSYHAIERYRQRVAPGSSYVTARLRLEQIVALGRTRSTPRRWMRGQVSPTPGLRFLYWCQRPDICALLIDDVVLTVVTRAMFTGLRTGEARPVGRPRTLETSDWRWDGQVADDLEAA